VPIPLPAVEGFASRGNGDGAQPPTNGRGRVGGWLRVLPAGALPPDPGELVGTRAVADIISRLRESSDLVIIDAPPLFHVGDAMTLSARVDAVLTIVKLDILRSPALAELRRVLETVPARKVGYVLTGVEAMEDYYYGYGSYYAQRPPRAERGQQTAST
jgi:Mrp family chromosome partitioning ATPase